MVILEVIIETKIIFSCIWPSEQLWTCRLFSLFETNSWEHHMNAVQTKFLARFNDFIVDAESNLKIASRVIINLYLFGKISLEVLLLLLYDKKKVLFTSHKFYLWAYDE